MGQATLRSTRVCRFCSTLQARPSWPSEGGSTFLRCLKCKSPWATPSSTCCSSLCTSLCTCRRSVQQLMAPSRRSCTAFPAQASEVRLCTNMCPSCQMVWVHPCRHHHTDAALRSYALMGSLFCLSMLINFDTSYLHDSLLCACSTRDLHYETNSGGPFTHKSWELQRQYSLFKCLTQHMVLGATS